MLILSRKVDDRIVISTPGGEKIEIVIVDIHGSIVSVGIDAPRDVHIVRKELVQ